MPNSGVKTLALGVIAAGVTFASFIGLASAEQIDVAKCGTALVQATYNRSEARFRDWRLAQHVTEATYNEIKKSAGLNVVIYGVPVGANWDEFRKNITNSSNDRTESLTESEYKNIAWTGLESNNVAAYSACLDALVTAAKGLSLTVIRATEQEVIVRLSYFPRGAAMGNTSPIDWGGLGVGLFVDKPPAEAVTGHREIALKRPQAGEVSVSVFSKEAGDGSSIILSAIKPPPPPAPEFPAKCAISQENANKSLRRNGVAEWDCPALRARQYRVQFQVGGHTPQGATRINYSVRLKPAATAEAITLSSINVGDFSVPPNPNLFPGKFFINDQKVTIPKGVVTFSLAIAGVYGHHDFKNGDWGAVNITSVVISLEKSD